MNRLLALLTAGLLAFGQVASAQIITGNGGGSSIATPVTPTNGGSGVANTGNWTWNADQTFSVTSGKTMTFPTTSATIARTDAAQTFTGNQTFSNGVNLSGGAASYLAFTGSDLITGNTVTCSATGGSPTCTKNAAVGTATIKMTLGSCSSCTSMTITPGFTAANIFICQGFDATTTTEEIRQSGGSNTTAVMTFYNRAGTATSPGASDVIYASCFAN